MQPMTLQHLGSTSLALFGLGREGWSTYQCLRQHWPSKPLLLIDDQPLAKLDRRWQEAAKSDPHLTFTTSDDQRTLNHLQDIQLIIKTPGVPLSHQFFTQAAVARLPVTSNTQLLLDFIQTELQPRTPRPIITIGITGTKGKSTTTSVIHHLLTTADQTAFLGGNIGVPPLELWSDLMKVITETDPGQASQPLFIVLEMSSHQLAEVETSPHIAVIQNVVPEHLDYYPDFETYIAAKARIARFQKPEDMIIFNPEYETARQIAQLSPGRKLTFATHPDRLPPSATAFPEPVATIHDQSLSYHGQHLLPVDQLPLLGAHNWENVLPAVVIAKHFDLPTEKIVQGLRSFKPLAHRLEPVASVNGVLYVNDSLSTAPEAAAAALAAFPDRPIVLLAGGHDRHLEYGPLVEALLKRPPTALILFKPTGERILQELQAAAADRGQPLPEHHFVETMTEAVKLAHQLAPTGGGVLMSPASASFGQFKDYRDRGDQFKQAVLNLGK